MNVGLYRKRETDEYVASPVEAGPEGRSTALTVVDECVWVYHQQNGGPRFELVPAGDFALQYQRVEPAEVEARAPSMVQHYADVIDAEWRELPAAREQRQEQEHAREWEAPGYGWEEPPPLTAQELEDLQRQQDRDLGADHARQEQAARGTEESEAVEAQGRTRKRGGRAEEKDEEKNAQGNQGSKDDEQHPKRYKSELAILGSASFRAADHVRSSVQEHTRPSVLAAAGQHLGSGLQRLGSRSHGDESRSISSD